MLQLMQNLYSETKLREVAKGNYEKQQQRFLASSSTTTKKVRESPGSATITNRSPSQTPRGRENHKSKQAQTKQTHEKH